MPRDAGFSLIELIAVLIIIGALAVVALPRFNVGGFSQYSFHQELLAALRHAQKTANASGCEIDVAVNSAPANNYAIAFNGAGRSDECGDVDLVKPGGSGNLSGTAPDRVTITNGADFSFNAFGVPVSDTQQVIELDGGQRVVVEANTGYVHD